jgi:hypothetical protein
LVRKWTINKTICKLDVFSFEKIRNKKGGLKGFLNLLWIGSPAFVEVVCQQDSVIDVYDEIRLQVSVCVIALVG